MEKWTFFTLPELELPLHLVVQPVASRYTDWANPAHRGDQILKEIIKYIYIKVLKHLSHISITIQLINI
jgi:hypothetical protein